MSMREKIARAIDPGAFAAWQLAFDYEMRQSGDEVEARKFADWGHSLKHTYERADAVLDALMEPTWEMEGAGIQTDEVDSIDWVEALMDTGITSAQIVVVASYKAMLKAAKEGK